MLIFFAENSYFFIKNATARLPTYCIIIFMKYPKYYVFFPIILENRYYELHKFCNIINFIFEFENCARQKNNHVRSARVCFLLIMINQNDINDAFSVEKNSE